MTGAILRRMTIPAQTPPADITLRVLGPDDAPVLTDVVDQFWGLDAEAAHLQAFFADPSGCVVTAHHGEKLVGYTFGYRLPRFDGAPIALLWDLEVKSAHRNKGIASAMIERFRQETGTDRRALLLVEPDNTALQHLCEKLGAVSGPPAKIYRFDAEA